MNKQAKELRKLRNEILLGHLEIPNPKSVELFHKPVSLQELLLMLSAKKETKQFAITDCGQVMTPYSNRNKFYSITLDLTKAIENQEPEVLEKLLEIIKN